MKAFAALYTALDATTSTRAKLDALVSYFKTADAGDAAWAAYFLAGGKPRQVVPSRLLRSIAQQRAGLPEWLFEESYQAVGDLAETIAHVLPPASRDTDLGLASWVETRVLPLRGMPAEQLTGLLGDYWDELDWSGRFLLTKLIGGSFRVGVSRQLVVRALAEIAAIDHKRIAHRMVGWTDARRPPTAERFARLIAADRIEAGPAVAAAGMASAAAGEPLTGNPAGMNDLLAGVSAEPDETEGAGGRENGADDGNGDTGLPYPFFLAHPLQSDPALTLGDRQDWLAEWKWDGIRAQLVKRAGRVWLWSRGEDLITERFPEIVAAAQELEDGTVLDGEILAWLPGTEAPLPFAKLQPRITRNTLTRKILADAPAVMMVYDVLETAGNDLRAVAQQARRDRLEALPVFAMGDSHADTAGGAKAGVDADTGSGASAGVGALRLSPLIDAPSWPALLAIREESRARGVEGLMLKARGAHYGVGRTKAVGEWWKWKVDPYTADAVLLYAQRGHGRRASLYSDYTFAVWDGAPGTHRALVPFTKAYSGLSDEEIRRVDAIVRKTTLEKFGPVRSVTPTLVFEIAFEAIQASPRHKSGVAVRFPRMLRWRLDKHIDDADTLQTLQELLGTTQGMGKPDAPAAIESEPHG